MSKLTKQLLISGIVTTLAGAAIAAGIVNADNVPALHILFPTGVILLGLTLISRLFENELARYDREHSAASTPEHSLPGQKSDSSSAEKQSAVRKPKHA